MDEAKQTDIRDHEACTTALAKAAAVADHSKSKIDGYLKTIQSLEAARPWGTQEEYGGKFEKVYHAGAQGGSGAQFVEENVTGLFTNAHKGFEVANRAIRASVEVDIDGASLFTIDPNIASGMAATNKAVGTQLYSQTGVDPIDPNAVIPGVQDGTNPDK